MVFSDFSTRKPALAVLVLSAAFALAGCAGTGNAGGGSAAAATEAAGGAKAPLFAELPEAIQKAGTINVASNVEYPPFESFDTDGTTVVGIDRDIADELEKRLGVKIEFDHIAFDAIIPGLTSGRYDMGMSAMSDTLERQKQVDFLDYFVAGGGILHKTDSPPEHTTLGGLCGVHVGVVKGTTNDTDAQEQSDKCVAAGKSPVEITVYPGQSQAVLALKSDRIPIFLVDSTAGSVVSAESNGVRTMGDRYDEGHFGIVFPQGSEDLIKVVQSALEEIKADGTYKEILASYDQAPGEIDEFTVNGITE